jgi:DNA polymerase-3 subunit delta'
VSQGGVVAGPPAEVLFAEVVCQERALDVLAAAVATPVHAYLFLGPSGSGRRLAARGFAAALLCPQGGCGHCPHCVGALGGTHPDLTFIERSGPAVGVDEARRITVAAQRRPLRAARQVIVVTDLHLAERSAPALLKTLEEPPASTVFVLLADHVPPTLATVASRCVLVPFGPVPPAEVQRWLTERGVEAGLAAEVAGRCGGDLHRARLLAEDPHFSERVALWRSIPDRLDGSGATVAALARQVLEAAEDALQPLQADQSAEAEQLARQAELLGERGVPGRRDLQDRHHREQRQWRTAELRAGMAELARTYRDRLVDQLRLGEHDRIMTGTLEATGFERAVALITEASADLAHNPNELLLLEALLVKLSSA